MTTAQALARARNTESSASTSTEAVDDAAAEKTGSRPAGQGSGQQSPAGQGSARQRDPLLDNAKFVLIMLVFIGHAIEPAVKTGAGDSIYFFIYLFHMPAFVLICGYLAKSFDGSPKRVEKLITTLAVPYFLFWGIYALQSLSTGRNLPDGPLDPLWVTWFLMALFVWRLSVPLWKRIRWPIPIAIAISLAAGLVSTGDVLNVSRILGLLPFFVTGLFLKPEHIEFLRKRWVQAIAVVGTLATMVVTITHLEKLSREWVYWRESLLDRHFDVFPYGLPARIVFLVLAFCLTGAVLSLLPRRRTWFTKLGELTLYVYLLHGLVIRVGGQFGWYEITDQALGGYGALAANIAMAVLFTFVLCTPLVRWATRWAVEPQASWLLRQRPRRPADEPGPVGRPGAGYVAEAVGEREAVSGPARGR